MPDNSMERQIKDLMEGLEFKPDAAVWDKVKAGINPENKRRVFGWKIPLLVLLVAAGGFAWWWGHDEAATTPAATVAQAETGSRRAEATVVTSADSTISVVPGETSTEITNGSKGKLPASTVSDNAVTASVPKKEAFVTTVVPKAKAENSILSGLKPLGQSGSVSNGLPVKEGKTVSATPPVNGAPENDDYGQKKQQSTPVTQSPANNSSVAVIGGQDEETATTKNAVGSVPDKSVTKVDSAAAPVITASARKTSGWDFYPYIGGGIAVIKGEQTYVSPNPDKDQPASAPNSFSPIVASSTIGYSRSHVKTGTAFSGGVIAEKELFHGFSLQTGLRYQYISYGVTTSNYKDTIGRMANGLYANIPAGGETSTDNYKMHYIGIPVLFHYDVTKPMGITAGIINDFTVAASKNGESVKSSLRTWMPSAYFAFVVKVPDGGRKYRWELMPYLQYGLSNVYKTGDQKMVQPGLQLVLRKNK